MLNVNNDRLMERLKRSETNKKKSLEKAVQTRIEPGLYSLAVTGFESTTFITEKYGEVWKITLYIQPAQNPQRSMHYPLREEFPFFVFTGDNGEKRCPQFDYLLAFCRDGFGKIPKFSDGAMASIVKSFETFFDVHREKPFYGIVIHREEVYKDKVITVASLYRNSVSVHSSSVEELKKVAGRMNKHWPLSRDQKKKLIQKSKHRPAEYTALDTGQADGEEDLPLDEKESTGEANPAEDDMPF